MAKIRKIFDTSLPINFNSKEENFNDYWDSFLNSELGKIYQVVPWGLLVKEFGLKEPKKGRTAIFPAQGKIALQFLKPFTGVSDKRLMERINSDYQFQFFCGIDIPVSSTIKNFKIISEIRTELGKKLNIEAKQKVLAKHWKPYLKETKTIMEDATCYESWMRYPTDVKLLWESVDWIYNQVKLINKTIKGRMPRSKYGEQKDKQLVFNKKKRKTKKETRKRIKSLLYLLDKLLEQLSGIEKKLPEATKFPKRYYKRCSVIIEVMGQQQKLYEGEKVSNRIVSVDKDYIRPIVRGKETKRVEFGPKANIIQVDGINFIEHISFDAFNEGTRLVNSVEMVQQLFDTKVTMLAGDNIYGTNANRKYCSSNGIQTSFVRKGRASTLEPELKSVRKKLNVERATRMEGAFGVQKNHYTLDKIKARIEKNELLWVFFGIHLANAVEITKRKAGQNHQKLKQAA